MSKRKNLSVDNDSSTKKVKRDTVNKEPKKRARKIPKPRKNTEEPSDHYETMPFDLRFMLEQNCCRNHDLIWDPFVCAGFSQQYIRHLGFNIVSNITNSTNNEISYIDFFTLSAPPPKVTIIITNPPFSKKREVLQKLLEFNLPFSIILPADVLQRDYLSDIVAASIVTHHWEVWLPNKTLSFHVQGVVEPLAAFKSAFFTCRPLSVPTPTNNCRRCELLCNSNVVTNDKDRGLHDVKISLFDYAKLRKDAGCKVANRPFYATGDKIGEPI